MQSDGTFDFDLRELVGYVSESIYQFLTAETNLKFNKCIRSFSSNKYSKFPRDLEDLRA